MKTYICSEILTQLSLFALIILITKNKVLSKTFKSGLIVSSILIMLCAISEFVGELFEGGIISSPIFHTFVKYTELCLTPIVPVVLTGVYPLLKTRKFAFIPCAVHVFLETLSAFTGFIFKVDHSNGYHHGRFYWLYYFFVFFSVLYFLCATIRFGIKFQNRNFVSLIVIIGFILLGTVFQATDSNIRIVWLTVAIGVILFYIYYCNMIYQVDSLTELLNRRAYDIHKSLLKKRAYIIFFDVNNFKSINDSFGHTAGDSCLKCVANTIRETYDKIGLCYRIGGDEFCVITDKKARSGDIENLNKKFNNLLLTKNCNNMAVPSVAIGYAFFNPKKSEISRTVKYADEQMYLNKHKNDFEE